LGNSSFPKIKEGGIKMMKKVEKIREEEKKEKRETKNLGNKKKIIILGTISWFLTIIALFGKHSISYAQELVVATHPSAPDLSIEDLKKIYLGDKKNLPDGTKVIPILIKGTPEEFFQKVTGMTKKQFFQYWMIRIVGGGSTPPKDAESEEQTVNLIKDNKGAIGIVSAERAKKEGLKIITIIK
jgi:hypothetical protein